jgi:pyruvate dehydrogenase E2 component (dihydrolipoamide acetyltransferase)
VIEFETDKAVVEIPSSVAGIIQEIKVKANQEAKVGDVVLVVSDDVASVAKPEAPAAPVKEEAKTAPTILTPPTVKPPTATPVSSSAPVPVVPEVKATPAPEPKDRKLLPAAPSVRRMAREMGVSLQQVAGSGIMGRISADDLMRFSNGGATAVTSAAPQVALPPLPDFAKWGETERTAMNGIRKATVRAMTNAWSSVPLVTHFDKADSTQFEAMRKKFQPRAEATGTKLTPTALLLKIIAAALKRFPDFNSSIDVANNEIVRKKYINIGVAVDTENGLLVPVVKNADQKSVIELAKELGDLAAKARARKLSPDDMSGGNFSISNLGGIGGTGFTPIVNPPDVGILGVSRGSFEPIWNQATNTFEPKMMMPLAVSYDHRLIDGAGAARFLRWVCEAIEEPFLMMLE